MLVDTYITQRNTGADHRGRPGILERASVRV